MASPAIFSTFSDARHSVRQRSSLQSHDNQTVVSAFERSRRRIISMSPAYRADSLAQAIEEAARIFGPEVAAAALLAAVEVASVRSSTPSRSFRRKLWTTLAVIAFATLAGAAVFGGG